MWEKQTSTCFWQSGRSRRSSNNLRSVKKAKPKCQQRRVTAQKVPAEKSELGGSPGLRDTGHSRQQSKGGTKNKGPKGCRDNELMDFLRPHVRTAAARCTAPRGNAEKMVQKNKYPHRRLDCLPPMKKAACPQLHSEAQCIQASQSFLVPHPYMKK